MLLASINQQINEFKLTYQDGEVLISGGIVKEILKDLPKSINYIDNLVWMVWKAIVKLWDN